MLLFGLFLLSTDPGIANVASGVEYSINGAALVGTASGGGGGAVNNGTGTFASGGSVQSTPQGNFAT